MHDGAQSTLAVSKSSAGLPVNMIVHTYNKVSTYIGQQHREWGRDSPLLPSLPFLPLLPPAPLIFPVLPPSSVPLPSCLMSIPLPYLYPLQLKVWGRYKLPQRVRVEPGCETFLVHFQTEISATFVTCIMTHA